MNHYRFIKYFSLILYAFGTAQIYALTFALPRNSDMVGTVQTATVQWGESLADIGRKFDIGIYEMKEANPDLDTWSPGTGDAVVIPSQFLLPPGQRKGMIINLAEMRIYYFHPHQSLVSTYPIGIGRKGWLTPLGDGTITEKKENPQWRPPPSIRAEFDKAGQYLPDVVEPGPQNPLGKFAMRLSIPGYMIHGTNHPKGIGIRSSSGCIRLYPEDIESLFHQVPLGTHVKIIHSPYKLGKHKNKIYIEAHEPIADPYYTTLNETEMFVKALTEATMDRTSVHWDSALSAIKHSRGYPILIQ